MKHASGTPTAAAPLAAPFGRLALLLLALALAPGAHCAVCPVGSLGTYCQGGVELPCLAGYFGNATGQTQATCSGACSAAPGFGCAAGSTSSAYFTGGQPGPCPGGSPAPALPCAPTAAYCVEGLTAQPPCFMSASTPPWYAGGLRASAQLSRSGVAVDSSSSSSIADSGEHHNSTQNTVPEYAFCAALAVLRSTPFLLFSFLLSRNGCTFSSAPGAQAVASSLGLLAALPSAVLLNGAHRLHFFAALLFFALPLAEGQLTNCVGSWRTTSSNSSVFCFLGVKTAATYVQALTACSTMLGPGLPGQVPCLASVHSDEEYSFITSSEAGSIWGGTAFGATGIWTGVTFYPTGCNGCCACSNSNWRWAKGDSTAYITSAAGNAKWFVGEPNGGVNGPGARIELGGYRDTNFGSGNYWYVCSYPRCATGYFYSLDAVTCAPCPASFYCVSGAPVLCPAGHFCPSFSTDATPCSAGTASAPTGAASSATCVQCQPGTYSAAGASICSPCPAGTYGATAGLTSVACTGSCTAAPGAYCPAGSTLPTATSVCPIGAYCAGGAAANVSCYPVTACTVTGLSVQPPCYWNVSTLAGNSLSGSSDGYGSSAGFSTPLGVALGSNGFYVAEYGSSRVRLVSPSGLVSTVAGSTAGFADGLGTLSRFSQPVGVAVNSSSAVIYIADTANHRIRRILAGVVSTIAGSSTASFADGVGTASRLRNPAGVAVFGDNLFVADQGNHRVRMVNAATLGVSTLAGNGVAASVNGLGTNARFNEPFGLAVSSSGSIFVAEQSGNLIRSVTPAGLVSTLAGSGAGSSSDGVGLASSFNLPRGIFVDLLGMVFVAEFSGNRIRQITPGGIVTTIAGGGGSANGWGTAVGFSGPCGVVATSSNVLIVPDGGTSIRQLTCVPCPASFFCASGAPVICPAGAYCPLSSIAATPCPAGTASAITGAASNATCVQCPPGTYSAAGAASCLLCPAGTFGSVSGLASPACSGNCSAALGFFCAAGSTSPANATQCLPGTYCPGGSPALALPCSPATACSVAGLAAQPPCYWNVSLLAGSGSATWANGQGTAASFYGPHGVSVDPYTMTVLVGDWGNNRVRRITLAGLVTTFAGSGSASFADGLGTAASFREPHAVPVDAQGTCYVADFANRRIRLISPTGLVTTLAGNGASATTNGVGTAASFNGPTGIALTSGGATAYIVEQNGCRIRAIALSTKSVTSLAGSATCGFADGTGTNARFIPTAAVWHPNGLLYVADWQNHRVRSLDTATGRVTTLAGNGVAGSSDGLGTLASFGSPRGVALDKSGRTLYVSENSDNRIRAVNLSTGLVQTIAGSTAGYINGFGTAAAFWAPVFIDTSPDGVIFVVEGVNNRVRQLTCVPCPASFYCTSGAPLICPAGAYCPFSSVTSTPCPAGTASAATGAASSATCVQCLPGSFSGAGAASCSLCPAGSYCPFASVNATLCPVDSYCPAGSAAPTPCACGGCPTTGLAAPSTCAPSASSQLSSSPTAPHSPSPSPLPTPTLSISTSPTQSPTATQPSQSPAATQPSLPTLPAVPSAGNSAQAAPTAPSSLTSSLTPSLSSTSTHTTSNSDRPSSMPSPSAVLAQTLLPPSASALQAPSASPALESASALATYERGAENAVRASTTSSSSGYSAGSFVASISPEGSSVPTPSPTPTATASHSIAASTPPTCSSAPSPTPTPTATASHSLTASTLPSGLSAPSPLPTPTATASQPAITPLAAAGSTRSQWRSASASPATPSAVPPPSAGASALPPSPSPSPSPAYAFRLDFELALPGSTLAMLVGAPLEAQLLAALTSVALAAVSASGLAAGSGAGLGTASLLNASTSLNATQGALNGTAVNSTAAAWGASLQSARQYTSSDASSIGRLLASSSKGSASNVEQSNLTASLASSGLRLTSSWTSRSRQLQQAGNSSSAACGAPEPAASSSNSSSALVVGVVLEPPAALGAALDAAGISGAELATLMQSTMLSTTISAVEAFAGALGQCTQSNTTALLLGGVDAVATLSSSSSGSGAIVPVPEPAGSGGGSGSGSGSGGGDGSGSKTTSTAQAPTQGPQFLGLLGLLALVLPPLVWVLFMIARNRGTNAAAGPSIAASPSSQASAARPLKLVGAAVRRSRAASPSPEATAVTRISPRAASPSPSSKATAVMRISPRAASPPPSSKASPVRQPSKTASPSSPSPAKPIKIVVSATAAVSLRSTPSTPLPGFVGINPAIYRMED